jgi:hypothetical protein
LTAEFGENSSERTLCSSGTLAFCSPVSRATKCAILGPPVLTRPRRRGGDSRRFWAEFETQRRARAWLLIGASRLPLRLQSATREESRSPETAFPSTSPFVFPTTAGIRFTAPKPDLYLYNVVIRLHSVGRPFSL